MHETELLERCLAGDARAWRALIVLAAPSMHAVVGRLLARGRGPELDIEDTIQAVFLKLWEDERRRLRTFRGGCKLTTWLVAVARREALDLLRGRERHERHSSAYDAQERLAAHKPDGPLDVASGREAGARVAAALAALPARDRLLVTLIGEEGWTYRSVARVLNLRENSIGPLLQRARARLGTVLAEEPGA